MNEHEGPKALRFTLRIISVIMIGAGSVTALLGAGSLPNTDAFTAVIDSEMRFYAIWYVVTGLVLWRASDSPSEQTWIIRVVGIAFFTAGCARALSWVWVGAPHWTQAALLSIELVFPFIILPWQAAMASRESGE